MLLVPERPIIATRGVGIDTSGAKATSRPAAAQQQRLLIFTKAPFSHNRIAGIAFPTRAATKESVQEKRIVTTTAIIVAQASWEH